MNEASRRTVVRQIIRPTIGILAIVAVVLYVLVPQIAGARKTISLLAHVNPAWIVLAIIAEIAALLSYVRLTQLTLGPAQVSFATLARIDLSTMAVSHVVPAGSVIGMGLGYRLLVRAGVPRSQAVAGKTLQTIGSAVVLNVLLFIGLLVALLFYGGSNKVYLPIVVAGLLLLLAVAWAVTLIMRREQRVIAVVNALLTRLRVNPAVGSRLVESLATTLHQLGNDRVFLRRTVGWATLNWLLDALSLWCCVRAFGHTLDPIGLLVGYGLANVGAALPFTPGGLGVVEGILVPSLVAFGSDRGVAILGVLTWRLFSFWIPIPIGLACYAPMARPSDSHSSGPDDDDHSDGADHGDEPKS